LHQEGIARTNRADQGQGTRRGAHPVPSANIILDEHRDAMQRSARTTDFSFLVQGLRQRQGVGIQLDHGLQSGAGLIQAVDLLQVFAGQ
jgi:hypothetical protein